MRKSAIAVSGLILGSVCSVFAVINASGAEEHTVVDVLMEHYSEWNSTVMDTGYLSCGAVFLDLDFDGIPELLTGGFSSSGRLTATEFYRIENDSVENLDVKSTLNSFPSFLGEKLQLYKDADGLKQYCLYDAQRYQLDTLVEYFCGFAYDTSADSVYDKLFFSTRESTAAEKSYRWMEGTEEIEISQTDYEKRVNSFFSSMTDLHLSYKPVVLRDCVTKEDVRNKLIESYDAFTYDGRDDDIKEASLKKKIDTAESEQKAAMESEQQRPVLYTVESEPQRPVLYTVESEQPPAVTYTVKDEYIFFDVSTRYLTAREVETLTAQQACYAKNEVYAIHGRKFVSAELQKYFGSKSWYHGTVEPSQFSDNVFNEFERANIQTLVKREEELCPGGYQLDKDGYDISLAGTASLKQP